MDISTNYMGLTLKNPFIASSSRLTSTVEGVKKLEKAGFSAVVLKSLFEEQIFAESEKDAIENLDYNAHPEAMEYIHQTSMMNGPEKYLDFIKSLKNEVNIPIIASLNCIELEYWKDFASKVEKAGADGIELNISYITSDPNIDSKEIEDKYVEILKAVKSVVRIPVSVKLSPFFTAPSNLIRKLERAGASAVVLFNRFYQLDIDTKTLSLKSAYALSSETELSMALRWTALLSNKTKLNIIASRGIFSGKDAVKTILAGACAVQTTSVILKKGEEFLSEMLEELKSFMEEHNFKKIDDFKGLVSQKEDINALEFERLQYIKAVVGIE